MPSHRSSIPVGKLPQKRLSELLDRLGPLPPEVRLGPAIGEDAAVIEVPQGVLVAASDPVTLTSADVGGLAVVVNANDVAVCGARPRWFLATVLLPPGTGSGAVEEIFDGMTQALDGVGARLVGGHTEITTAVAAPVVVGQMLGLIEGGTHIAGSDLGAGDFIAQIGPAPVEGGAVLAAEAPELAGLDPTLIERARAGSQSPGLSIVEQALLAADLGARSLHDPTEGGLAGGLHEMAHAAGVKLCVDRGAVIWFEPALEICHALGADPWATLASGTLLAAFTPADAEAALAELASRGYEASIIGQAEPGSGVVGEDGGPIALPDRDEVARILSTA
jgi:hydrogenase maturation factor